MLRAATPVRNVLIAIFLLMLGNGFIATLLSVRMEAAGGSASAIGLLAALYFAGLTVGSLRVPAIVLRVGHIRSFALVVSLLSASTLAYSLHMGTGFWAVLRFVDGFCVAGVFICAESWLNHKADPLERGSILAAYMIALYAGQAAGQFLLGLNKSAMLPFIISSILISLSALPVLLSRTEAPEVAEPVPFSLASLFRASPLGLVGTGATGLILGAFYGLGPVYARRLGLDLSAVALFMSLVIAGGVCFQWPVGHLSDRFDRRRVIVSVLAGGLVASLLLTQLHSAICLYALGAIFGGLAFTLYPLCVAHTNDRMTVAERLSASSGLIFVYSIGAMVGPLVGSFAIYLLEAPGLFWFTGSVAGATLIFAFWRQAMRVAVADDLQQPFQVLPRTTPMAAPLEPASDEA